MAALSGPFSTNTEVTCACGKTYTPPGEELYWFYKLGGRIIIVDKCCGDLLRLAALENAETIAELFRQESQRLRVEAGKLEQARAQAHGFAKANQAIEEEG